MKFSIKNLVWWTLILGLTFMTWKAVGPITAVFATSFLIVVAFAYEDGLNSSGFQSRLFRDRIGPLQASPKPAEPQSPAEPSLNQVEVFSRGAAYGPALYLVYGSVAGFALTSISFATSGNRATLVLSIVGTIVGAILYRVRSSDWPIDPKARQKQHTTLWLCVVSIPISITLTEKGLFGAPAMAIILALGMVPATLISRRRRDGTICRVPSADDGSTRT